MTAHAMKGDRERFLASGMDHYISKPFHKDELLLLIKSIESRVMNTPPREETRPAKKRVALDGFLKAMGGDETLFLGACDLFAEMIPERVQELRGALEARQAQPAERVAHNLRASLLEANLRSRDFPGALAHFAKIEHDIRNILAEIENRSEASPLVG